MRAFYQPKPYKKFDRALNKWVTVIPEPKQFLAFERLGGKTKKK